MKARNTGIDLLKFLAVLLIVNFHAKSMYPKWSFLGTGGDIGNALFFYSSGVLLYGGIFSGTQFVPWIKCRLARLLPTLIGWSFIAAVLSATSIGNIDPRAINTYSAMTAQPWWFIRCLMLYYFFYWFGFRFFAGKIKIVTCLALSAFVLRWLFICCVREVSNSFEIYHSLVYFMFFPMMALGACDSQRDSNGRRTIIDVFLALICLGGYISAHHFSIHQEGLSSLFLVSTVFLLCFCHYAYMVARSQFCAWCMDNRIVKGVVMFVGGLSLEIYVSHFCLITTKYNGIFPLNMLILLVVATALAYVVRVFSRFLGQTLSNECGYDWRKMFGL